jgi:hypothetical protein
MNKQQTYTKPYYEVSTTTVYLGVKLVCFFFGGSAYTQQLMLSSEADIHAR